MSKILSKHIDFDVVNNLALDQISYVLNAYLPGGKYIGNEYQPINPTRKDNKSGSFSINTITGVWADFAIDASGSDVISLISYVKGLSQYDAAKNLAELLGVFSIESQETQEVDKHDLELICAGNHGPLPRHYKFGEAAYTWTYHDSAGVPLFHICRFTIDDGKTYQPLTLWSHKKGRVEWRWKGYSKPYPLYNLHLISKYRSAQIVVCEGEKAADAAGVLFPIPNYVTTTFAHGAKAINNTDWNPLHDRDVILWPDHDHAGEICMSSIFKLLGGNNAIKRKDSSKLDKVNT